MAIRLQSLLHLQDPGSLYQRRGNETSAYLPLGPRPLTLCRRGLSGHIRSGKDGSAEMVGVPVHLAHVLDSCWSGGSGPPTVDIKVQGPGFEFNSL